jgi:hypothetical protein
MEARLKAKELIDKFDKAVNTHTNTPLKKCALIAVDELIYETQFEVPNIRQRYWIDVKQELEKL